MSHLNWRRSVAHLPSDHKCGVLRELQWCARVIRLAQRLAVGGAGRAARSRLYSKWIACRAGAWSPC